MSKNYYEILGVPESSSDEEIKNAYKRLAKKYHPDKHSGNKVFEEKFKEVSQAYQTLSNPKQRAEYDQTIRFRQSSYGQQQTGFNADFDLNEILNQFRFASGGRRQATGGFNSIFHNRYDDESDSSFDAETGADIHSELKVPFIQATTGGSVEFEYHNETQKTIRVQIPPGIEDGEKIKLKGQGRKTRGRTGDLILTIRVEPDSFFHRKGLDVYCNMKLNLAQLVLGSNIRVRTVYDELVDIRIPVHTQPGTLLKASGLGIRSKKGTGDFYVTVTVELPEQLNKKQRELFETFARSCKMI
jgi:molecular chaperone DnaJ